LSSPRTKHSASPLIELSASEVVAILRKFVLKEATSEPAILNCTWQPGRVYVTSFRSTRKEKNLQLTLYPSQGQQNVFLQAIIHFTILTAIIFGVWSKFGSK